MTGREDEPFLAEIARRHGPDAERAVRTLLSGHEALYHAAREVDEHAPEYEQRFRELDEDEAIEQAAERRAAWMRREERIRARALELLGGSEDGD